jgi:hypothetical protein
MLNSHKLKLILTLTLLAVFTLAFPRDICLVQRVVDGDTIVLDNGMKVRLIVTVGAWIWFYYLIKYTIGWGGDKRVDD